MPENITSGGEPPVPTSALQVLVAGANLWFVAVGFPWLFIEQPTLAQSIVHALPLSVLLIGVAVLQWAGAATALRSNARLALVVGMPVSVGLATALRGEEINRLALPGWALLLCVASLWVFVGVLGTAETTRPASGTTPAAPPAGRFKRSSSTLVQLVTVVAAAVMVTLAPRWTPFATHDAAARSALAADSLLTTAAATAIAVGTLLIVLGPTGVTATPAAGSSLRQRLLPLLLMAAIGAATYALTSAGR